MYYYESLIKSVWKKNKKCIEKKTIMKNCIDKQNFQKKKKKITLKNMPDCGR